MKTLISRAAAAGLMALLVSGAAWAVPGDEDKAPQKIEKHRIVIVGPDGKEKVIEGDGPLVRRGYLGVGLTELTPALRTHFGVPESSGVMVSEVEDGSPADKAGIEVGDIITRMDGKDVRSSFDVRSRIRELDENQQVPLEVWRDGKAQTISATIALRERPELDMGPFLLRHGEGGDGPITLQLNKELGDLPRILGPDSDVRFERRLASPREHQLEQRLQELEKRIADLEKQLAKKGN